MMDKTQFVYQVGLPAGEGGRSTLRVCGDGTVALENERLGRKPRRFAGRVDVATMDSLIALAERSGLWSRQRRATAIPDEAPVELTLLRDGKASQTVMLWEGQLDETDDLRALREKLSDLIRRTSGGKAY
jgi:hypothetical protein